MIFGRIFKTVTLGLGLSLAAGSVSAATVIPQKGWKLLWTTSQELSAENGAAVNAFDGNPKTIWHTEWSRVNKAGPHEIRIDLGNTYSISGFKYLPRPTTRFSWSHNGRIAKYALYVGTSPTNLGAPVATGTFGNDGQEKMVIFNARSGRYVRLVALSEVNGNPWASAAEINFLGSGGGVVAPASGTDAAKPIAPSTPAASPSTPYVPTAANGPSSGNWWSNEDSVNWRDLIARSTGTIYRISSPANLDAITRSLRPGDIVLFEDGVYRGGSFKITSSGTADRPIIYTARNPGRVIFDGQTVRALHVTGSHNLIGGFKFRGCASFAVVFARAGNNRFTDSEFRSCGTVDGERIVEVKELSHRNRFDHLLFDDLRANGIAVYLSAFDVRSGPSTGTRIDNNIFQNSSEAKSNGREAIQIGQGSGWSGGRGTPDLMTRAEIEFNSFVNVARETIEIKASGNVIRGNTLRNVAGGLSLREGNKNVVDGNYLLHTRSGISVRGENHVVRNNVVVDTYRGNGISVNCYGKFQLSPDKWSSFPPTGNNIIANNTIVDAYRGAIAVGVVEGYPGYQMADIPPYNNSFFNNILVGAEGTLLRLISGSGTVVRNNLYYSRNNATNGFTGSGAIVGNPGLSSDGLSISSTSAANGRGLAIPQVQTDYFGRARGGQPDVGAVER